MNSPVQDSTRGLARQQGIPGSVVDFSTGRQTSSTGSFDSLRQGVPDSIYVLTEKFDDFKKVGAMTLPHSYTLDYSVEGQGSTFIAKWTMKASQWAFNRALDERLFVAQK